MYLWEVMRVYDGSLKKIEYQRQIAFNAARFTAFYQVLSVGPKIPPRSPEDLCRFEWDSEPEKPTRMTEEEWKKFDNIFPDKIDDTRSDSNIIG